MENKNYSMENLKERIGFDIVGMDLTCINCGKHIVKRKGEEGFKLDCGNLVSNGKVVCEVCGCNAFKTICDIKLELKTLPEEKPEEEKKKEN